MAKILVEKIFGLDMRDIDFSSLFNGVKYTAFSSLFRAFYSNGAVDEFRGFGFKYDSTGIPTDGTVTSYGTFISGVRFATVDGLRISVDDIVKVASTYSTKDDTALIKKALAGNDSFKGGNGADLFWGHNGNDTLSGNYGNDRLYGGSGNDKLIGGRDADKLYGGSGADTFIFKSILDSRPTTGEQDKIYDFSRSQGDKLDVSGVDANLNVSGNQAFSFIGVKEFTQKAGQLRYELEKGETIVLADANGDGVADVSFKIDNYILLKAGDFIL